MQWDPVNMLVNLIGALCSVPPFCVFLYSSAYALFSFQPSPVSMAEASHSWWKLTFLRKKKSTPKVVYESVTEHIGDEKAAEETQGENNYTARLERIVDKNTKGKHVKVSNSGRFKERKKVRPALNETPGLCPEPPPGQ
ncbi:hypothetical protein XELAEV_18045975mg [Xenopus laevis]|uniref:Uncharacterized protein n=1 Tax=Xenopus laevis TaxID=8355 RepID=A0A974H0H1_XENLA|nr:hypothetical protein XELAEV_18045975mg [Xenopus laevis]